MKTSKILLSTTILFALLTVTFGYQGLLDNYKHWICWDYCPWITEDCEEICKDVEPINQVELTREERRDYSQKLRDMYDPLLQEYTDKKGIIGGLFSRGYGYSHPDDLKDNLEATFEYSDGFLKHFEKLEIVSPLGDSEDAEKIFVLKEMTFPELYVFWIFTIGIGVLVGFKIRK